jgi:hypothetical protein
MKIRKQTELESAILDHILDDGTELHKVCLSALAEIVSPCGTTGSDFPGELRYWCGNEITTSCAFTREALNAALHDVDWCVMAAEFIALYATEAHALMERRLPDGERGPERGDV